MLLRHVRPHWPLAVSLVFCLLATTALQLLGPGLLGAFVDGATSRAATGALLTLGLIYLASVLCGGVFDVLAEAVGGRLAWRSTNALREDLLRHCLNADLDFHSRHSPGELISRVDGDTAKLADFASRLLIMLAVNVLLMLGISAVLFTVDWRIGLGCALLIMFGMSLVRRMVGTAVSATTATSAAAADVCGYVEEHVRGIEDLAPNGATAHTLHGLTVRSGILYRARKHSVRLQVRWPRTAQHLNWIAVVAGLAGAIVLHQSGALSLGDVYAVVAYLTLLRVPLLTISNHMSQIDEALAALRRSRELLAEAPTIVPGDTDLPAGALSVEVDAVEFAYADRAVLRGVSLTVPAGKQLALVGVSGGGKTTIARLLTRMLDPYAGAVRVGGVDLREVSAASARGSITYVTQEVRVLAASVRDNVAVYDDGITDARITEVLRTVGLGTWLAGLPEGLRTVLGGEHGLSAGQEQLLAIARVLLRDPGLVILDEASSRIPPADREAVSAAVRTLLSGRTSVLIAHRLDTVASADAVAVVEDGRIAEYGTYTELSADRGSRLARALSSVEA
ncbi:ABC transporter ATP-binding protein [Phytomonospora sp. NPDC050363]|uniref:ABC transporter ATP-binding protein n=1 Tax=Phytomonospora sp. NPDC050363 TaxID=3155642 RepID=UPI0033F08508